MLDQIKQVARIGLVFIALLTPGCGDDPADRAREASNGSDQTVQTPLALFYETLQADALLFGFETGEWTEDYGDAAAFGPSFYLNAARTTGREDYQAIADAAAAYNLSVAEQATRNVVWYMDNLEEVFMAAQGLVAHAGETGDPSIVEALDDLLAASDEVVRLYDDYLEVSMGEFAADLYGPTSVTAGIALIYLQYAKFIDNDQRNGRVTRAAEIVQTIDEQAWDGSRYLFKPGEEELFLYPNATMMIVLNRLFELTGERAYLDRVETVYQGIGPLHLDETGFYRSPYSQAYQGAETDEYSTLSSQNYLSLALMLTYENTGDQAYLDDVLTIVDGIRAYLYVADEHKILHHWIDGRVANEDDPDYFCSGCNLQTLYILWYLSEELGVAL